MYYSKMKYSAEYRFNRACILTNFTGVEGSTQVQANFILPDTNKLALKAKSGSLAILLVNFGIFIYIFSFVFLIDELGFMYQNHSEFWSWLFLAAATPNSLCGIDLTKARLGMTSFPCEIYSCCLIFIRSNLVLLDFL